MGTIGVISETRRVDEISQLEVAAIRTKIEDPNNPTARYKASYLTACLNISEVGPHINRAEQAVRIAAIPGLTQIRVIMRDLDGTGLARQIHPANDFGISTSVNGRIPIPGTGQSLFYVTTENRARQSYNPEGNTHEQAVAKGMRGRELRNNSGWVEQTKSELVRNGITLHAVDFTNGIDMLTGQSLELDGQQSDIEVIASQLAGLFRSGFEYSHDPAQQATAGQIAILESSPVLLARKNGQVIAAGVLEADSKFDFQGWKLVEPTFVTQPGNEYRGIGISSVLRHEMRNLINSANYLQYYGPTIVFCESIRASSGPLSIANGFDLAADVGAGISGNLGEAYTYIGPANPETGMVPMILTYAATEIR
jgi:hypothetical protein